MCKAEERQGQESKTSAQEFYTRSAMILTFDLETPLTYRQSYREVWARLGKGKRNNGPKLDWFLTYNLLSWSLPIRNLRVPYGWISMLQIAPWAKNIWSRHRFNTTECYDQNIWPRNARIKVQCHCTPKDSLDKWYWMDRLNTIRHLQSGDTNEHHVLKVEYMQEEPIRKNYLKIDYI